MAAAMRRRAWPECRSEAIAAAVRTFRAVEHRLEFVRSVSGVDFYNDSKATSVDATLKALDAFAGGLWVILGGKDKGSDYTAAARAAGAEGARRAADRRGGGQDRRPTRGRRAAARCEDAGCGGRARLRARRARRYRAARSRLRQLRPVPRATSTAGEVFKELVKQLEPKEMAWRNDSRPTGFCSITVLVMVMFGMVIVYSASSIMAQAGSAIHSSWHFVIAPGRLGGGRRGCHDDAEEARNYRKLQHPGGGVRRDRRGAAAAGGGVSSSIRRTIAGCASGRSGCSLRNWPSRRW